MILNKQVLKYAQTLLYIVILMILNEDKAFARKYFLIERPKLALGFSYEFEEDKREGPDITRKDTATTFSEKLDIETEGWVYHPALMIYTLRLSPEWEQISEQTDGEDKRTSRTFLQGYFTEFTFLQYKPYRLNIFANKQMSTLRSSFAERSKTKSDTYGAMLMLKYKILPTMLNYAHLQSKQTGFFTTDTEADEFRLSMRHDKHLGDTTLKASYKDSTRTTQGISVNTKAQNATLQNYYNLTEDKRVTLASGLSYRSSKSDFTEHRAYGLSESLRWRHRKDLSTNYLLRYDKTTADTFSSDSKAVAFGLSHQLYENLTTSINADGSSSQFTGGKIYVYGAGLNFNYNRRIPWGMLNINMGHDYRVTKQDFIQDFRQVIDESVTLTDGVVTLLVNEHIDIGSIVVTDRTGTIVYLKDIDYRVTEIDSFVRISRIIGGRISNGQEVLVDYRYLSNPAFDYSTFEQSYGINLNLWSAWRIYYRFNHSKQKFLAGIPPDRLIDDSIHTAGTELDWKWSRTRLEYEDRQTTIIPITRWRVEETVILKPVKKLFLSFSGNYGTTKFKDTGEIERFSGIRGTIQMITSNWSWLRLEGFRNKLSGEIQKTTDSGFSSTFEWFYGIWRGSISYRFLNERDEISHETFKNNYLLFEIKRTLF